MSQLPFRLIILWPITLHHPMRTRKGKSQPPRPLRLASVREHLHDEEAAAGDAKADASYLGTGLVPGALLSAA